MVLVSVLLSDGEFETVERARLVHGAGVVDILVKNWVADRAQKFAAEDAAAFATKYNALNAKDQAIIDATLQKGV